MYKIMDRNSNSFWKKYYELAKDALPAKLLRVVVEKYLPDKGKALDVGAGHLIESMFLLEKGFQVTAIDSSEASRELANKIINPDFNFIQDTIQQTEISENTFSLAVATHILSHIPPTDFEAVLFKILKSLKPGGIFCGNFFGERDGWNIPESTKTFLTIKKVKDYFSDLEIRFVGEREFEDTFGWAQINNLQDMKHWHIISIVAIKK